MDYPDWLVINSIPLIQPSLESTTSLLSDDTSDDSQETERGTTTKTPYIKGVSEQIRRVFKQYDVPAYFKPINTLHQLLVGPKDKILKK